jgi:hypothetical protein
VDFNARFDCPSVCLRRKSPAHAKIEDVRLPVDVNDGVKTLILLFPRREMGEFSKAADPIFLRLP